MSVPSMVHRSGDSLIVRSVVSGAALYESADVDDDDYISDSTTTTTIKKELPDCKVKRNYSCGSCEFFTQNPRSFLYHLRDVHKEKVKIYECPSCLYASKHFQKLLRHTKMVHGSVEVGGGKSRKRPAPAAAPPAPLAEEGDDEGSNDESYEDDDQVQVEKPPVFFKCSLCRFSSRYQTTLSKHEREEHIKTKFFRCTKCTYVTHIKARFTKHVKYHSMPMIKCDLCDFRTPYKWNLDRHCKNHNGRGAFRCSACNFTADIKQSLTVHEMNHHVPPVGMAAGLGVGRRRNKVGASDATAAEEAAHHAQIGKSESIDGDHKKPRTKKVKPNTYEHQQHHHHQNNKHFNDFVHPDDLIQHANGKVYFKNKCKLCNFKSAWDGEMAKHEKKVHNINRDEPLPPPPPPATTATSVPQVTKSPIKKAARPIPNLIPIPTQAILAKRAAKANSEPTMSQKDINDICAKSKNSVLKDFASLFSSEDVFKNASPTTTNKVPDLIPTSVYTPKTKSNSTTTLNKSKSFFDMLRERLDAASGSNANLICSDCGHESKCLTEQAKHQENCGKETNKLQGMAHSLKTSSSRCQHCRQRCKSSADLYNHLRTCDAFKLSLLTDKEELDTSSEHEGELRIDEDQSVEDDGKPHPMENKVFVWNDIHVPMDIEVDDSNYEYTEDKVDDNVSLDLSIRTQSPGDSENSFVLQDYHNNSANQPIVDKIPTHGNDISVAQHKRVFKCPHCTFWASTASRFHVHIVGHLNKKPFECSLCSYRSNWRWDITKHIKLKSVRDPSHEGAKVLMTDETGRRNYTKYNKYLTEIPVTGDQSMDTSGGSGTRPKHHDRNASPSTSKDLPKLTRAPNSADFSPLLKGGAHLRPPPALKSAEEMFAKISEKKRPSTDSKRTLFKCKKCDFKNASRDVLLQHVKDHYQSLKPLQPHPMMPGTSAAALASDLSLRGTSPDKDERHCRLKHAGDIRVITNKNGQENIEVEEQPDEPDHISVPQDGTFKCRICPYSTDSHADFEQHQRAHNQSTDTVYKCYFCKYFVSSKEEIVDHLRLHGVQEPEDYIQKNWERPEGDGKKFKCILCPYVTNSKSQYQYHKQFHKPAKGGQYSCTECTYNVSKRHLLHQHLKLHGISVSPSKQSGETLDLDEITDEIIEEVPLGGQNVNLTFDTQQFADIPLVWVSKNGKYSKMFKCRYCPHVNLRKVNIQEHEKMHSHREKNPNSSRLNDIEHRCTECNYVCNNAGVLSSHSKVHQGLYGVVHRLVDPARADDEQIRELLQDGESLQPSDEAMDVDEAEACSGLLHFCDKCPARFFKENEFEIHKKLHGLRLYYKCEYCTYTAREKPHLQAHSQVHTTEYQTRTKNFQKVCTTSAKCAQPVTFTITTGSGDTVWIVVENNNKSADDYDFFKSKARTSQNVPLSGTDLFLQRAEAQQQAAAQSSNKKVEEKEVKPADPQFGTLMHGNPEFIYPTYLKNGRVKEKRYKCHKCPSAFEKREQYKVHLGLHGSKQRYNCDYCDYSVKYSANYVQHLKKHKVNDDAQAAKSFSDDIEEEEGGEDKEVKVEVPIAVKEEEKKVFRCTMCPYSSQRKDGVENHQKRHLSISGNKSNFQCEHCDYSAPQAHFLRDHTKLHFKPNSLVSQVEGYMMCDNLKLTSSRMDEGSDEELVFEELDDDEEEDEKKFLPGLSADVAERFNNNEGEKRFIDLKSGEFVEIKVEAEDVKLINTSDTLQSSETSINDDDEDCDTEVN